MNEAVEYRVRAARAEDIPFLAQIMLWSMLPAAGVGLFEPMLKDTGIDQLRFHETLLMTGANHWGRLEDFLVLHQEETLVAAASSYLSSQPDQRPLTPDGLEKACGYLQVGEAQKKEMTRQYIRSFGFSGDQPHLVHPAEYVIEYGAMSPDHRRLGLHRLLMVAHVKRARDRGHASVGTIAIAGNRLAFNAWARLGGKLHSTLGPEFFKNGVPGMHRFLWDLTDDASRILLEETTTFSAIGPAGRQERLSRHRHG